MASTAEKSPNLLVVCCLCLLSNSFPLGWRKRYPHRKCSYSNRKRASMIRINKTDLSSSKACLCVRCSHMVATAYVPLFLVCLKSDANLCIFPKKRARIRVLSHRLHKLKLLSLLHLLDLEDVLQRRIIKDLPVFTHLCVSLHWKQATTDVPVKFTQKQHMTDNINFKEPDSFTSCSCRSFFLDERLRCFSRTE